MELEQYTVLWTYTNSVFTADDKRLSFARAVGVPQTELADYFQQEQYIRNVFPHSIPAPEQFLSLGADEFKASHSVVDYVLFWARSHVAPYNLHVTQVEVKKFPNSPDTTANRFFKVSLSNYIRLNPYVLSETIAAMPAIDAQPESLLYLLKEFRKSVNVVQLIERNTQVSILKTENTTLPDIPSFTQTGLADVTTKPTSSMSVTFVYQGSGLARDPYRQNVTFTLAKFPRYKDYKAEGYRAFFQTLFALAPADISRLNVVSAQPRVEGYTSYVGGGSTTALTITFAGGTPGSKPMLPLLQEYYEKWVKQQILYSLLYGLVQAKAFQPVQSTYSNDLVSAANIVSDATRALQTDLSSDFKLVHVQNSHVIDWDTVQKVIEGTDGYTGKNIDFGGRKKHSRRRRGNGKHVMALRA